jgi:hypothetical protein
MGGRERLRPNRGLPVAPGTTRDPTLINRCGERNERFIDGSVFGYGLRQVFWALHLTAVRLWGGLRVFQGQPGSPGSDGASPYHKSSLHSSELANFILDNALCL